MQIFNGLLTYNDIQFDDFVDDVIDNGESEEYMSYRYWSQICPTCKDNNTFTNVEYTYNYGESICGIKGCTNESEFYVNFLIMGA